MKTILRILALLGLPIIALGQLNTLSTTTLNGAVTGGTSGSVTTIGLASTSNVVAPSPAAGTQGSVLYTWDGEAMQVLSVNTTANTVTVTRGYGTRSFAHATGILVWIGNGDWYSSATPTNPPRGTCTASTIYALPDIHILTDQFFVCDANSLYGYAGPTETDGQTRWARTAVNDTAYTALIYDRFIAYTAISAARVVTLPTATQVPGKTYTIKDESGNATSTFKIELNAADGSSTQTCVSAAYGSCTVQSINGIWQITGAAIF